MAERELKIIREARITLNDVVALNPRWSDERLTELLSDAQDDMCRNIPMIVNKVKIVPVSMQLEYRLPANAVKLVSASVAGRTLTLISYDEIERDNPEWEDATGHVATHIIVNALSQQTIRPYPYLTEDTYHDPIVARYRAMPVRLGWAGDGNTPEVFDTIEELTISDMWDLALKQYVIGMAFLDYGDESSTSRSQIAIGLYSSEKAKASKLAKSSFAKRSRTTGFQGKVANTRYKGGRYGSSNSGSGY